LRFTVEHRTVYHFRQPVLLGEHRLMIRPRDSHDLRLVSATLSLSPPGEVRWLHDVFGNSIAIVQPQQVKTDLFSIISRLDLERYPHEPEVREVEPRAARYPFVYDPSERLDLGSTLVVEDQSSVGALTEWLEPLVDLAPLPTLELLTKLNDLVHSSLTYEARVERGTQSARQTLERRSGSCRDYALLLIEAARTLGLGARFVTGYLYDPSLDGGLDEPDETVLPATIGAAATHAWADVFVPGAGWIELDPTNGTIGSPHLVRVAVTRSPTQAVPVSGVFTGSADDATGLDVLVQVTAAASR
jgi:transglutaminase-like putative cysteine protease